MTTRILALALVCAVGLYGQRRRFNWQDYCFNHPAAPFCSGRDYAIKRPAPTKGAAPPSAVTNPLPSTASVVTPSVIVVGGIDWRFADPMADALVGFHFNALSVSPLARNLIARFGANQGLNEAEIQKIFDRMSGADQVALSVRENRIVVMVSTRVTDSNPSASDADLKAVPVSGNAMLFGHADAVDQAVQRMAMKGPPSELARLAEEWPANSELWATGAAGLAGPQAMSAGVKRFSLTVSIRDRLTSDMALEFDEVPSASTLGIWQTGLGAATLEGKVIHVRTSIEADEVEQKFGQFAASPLGGRLAALVKAARYLPVRDTTVPRQTKPVIYGLEGGPKELNLNPSH